MFASAHGLGPATQNVKVSPKGSYIEFKMEAFNQRQDVSNFYVTVQDASNLKPVLFSSSDREFSLNYQISKTLTIFVYNDGIGKYRVCTWAKPKASTTVVSGVCSFVSVSYQ